MKPSDSAIILRRKSKNQLSIEACEKIVSAYPNIERYSHQDIIDRFLEMPRFETLMHQECNQFVRLSNSILVML